MAGTRAAFTSIGFSGLAAYLILFCARIVPACSCNKFVTFFLHKLHEPCKKFATIILQEEDLGAGLPQRLVRNSEPASGFRRRRAFGQRTTSPTLARCSAVDLALHRPVSTRDVRRIARGLYDVPGINSLTGKPTSPDPHDVIDALTRKGKVRILVDGITAANDLGLTDAVPARIEVLTDGRLRPIKLGNLTLDFHYAAPSRPF